MYNKLTKLGHLWRHMIILLALAFVFFPVVWVISASFDGTNTLVKQSLVPTVATLDNYKMLAQEPRYPFGRWMFNSIKVSGISAALSVWLCALAAYAFSRFRFKGRQGGLFTLILVQIFPQMLAVVSLYLLLLAIGRIVPAVGLNTHAGLIAVYLGGAIGINTWLMKGYFDTIPRSLEESAMLDGATPFVAFLRIILPLVRPILVVVFILSFIGTYSEFMLARVMLQSNENLTLAVGMNLFIGDQYAKRWGVFSAAAIMASAPIVLIFLTLQRQLISGLTQGGVKG
ncbi:MAG TPA: maltose ABC transporter permease MalG [Firmicutes bacterium]|nr:maltose ABC transporter permease MalG [Bacillota bacterium]